MGKKSARPSRELSKQITRNKLYEGQILYPCDEEYLNGYEVNPFEYMCIDRELRKEYEDEFGLDTKYTGYSYYTHEEQIEIYAKNMFFGINIDQTLMSRRLTQTCEQNYFTYQVRYHDYNARS